MKQVRPLTATERYAIALRDAGLNDAELAFAMGWKPEALMAADCRLKHGRGYRKTRRIRNRK